MYLLRDIALPTWKRASGLNGVTSTKSFDMSCLRYFVDVANRRRLSARTPTAVPWLSNALSMADWSMPLAPPETTVFPC